MSFLGRWGRPAWPGAALLLLLAALGCGYRTLGPKDHFGVTRICVMPFSESGPGGITGALTQQLVLGLSAEGFIIEPDANKADAVLTGQIELRNVPGTTLQTVQLYTVDVTVTAELWGEGREPLWQEAVSLQEDFLPTDAARDVEPLVTERRRRVATQRLTERAAQQLVSALRAAGSAAL